MRSDIEAQAARILRAKAFTRRDRLKRFLSYVVEHFLEGKTDRLKEVSIGIAVFDRPGFDPAKDSIVRNTAARLRRELDAYYEAEGRVDPIVISIPKGGYVPQFAIRSIRPASSGSWRLRWQWMVAAMTAVIAILGLRLLTVRTRPAAHSAEPGARRLFALATSEGRAPLRLRTAHQYGQLLISPDGKKLYALGDPGSRFVTVFGVADLLVHRNIDLPEAVGFLRISKDGSSLFGPTASGEVIRIDTRTGQVTEVARAVGQVFDLAVTPDGAKLFLAMGYSGLMRISLKTGESAILSSIACPTNTRLDPAGRYLYVGYECGGPRGRRGHDTVAVYDAETEKSVDIIGGDLPMVGGRQVISPNGETVLLDASNACHAPQYDHMGCEEVPSTMFHVWRASDRKTVLSRSFETLNGRASSFFPDGDRVLLLVDGFAVWNWARNLVLERVRLRGTSGIALTPGGDRAFVALENRPEMLVFDAEKESCLPPSDGLQNFYFADGSLDDSLVPASFTGSHVEFAPGRVGQAFRFDGKASFLKARTGSAWCPGCWHEWSASLFARFDSLEGEMSVLGITGNPLGWNLRLYKSRGNRIVLSSDGSKFPIESTTSVTSGLWYHIVIAVTSERTSLYVNGTLQRRQSFGFPLRFNVTDETVFLGSKRGERDFLRGLIDEVAVYNRELTPQEVTKLSAPCS